MSWIFPSDEGARTRRDRVLSLLFVIVLGFLVARAARKSGGVLVRNQEFGARFLAGEDPYFDPARGHRIHGPYPPTFVWLAAPLALMPTPLARIAWGCLQASALVVIAVVMRRWTRAWSPSLARDFPVFYAAALLLSSRYLLRDMAGGGANIVHAALAVLALEASARGRHFSAGASFAFSLACKPYLAPLAVFFVARGRWRTLAATLAMLGALFLLPGLVYGSERWVDLGRRWAGDVSAFVRLDDPTDPVAVPAGLPAEDSSGNQSLGAALRRAFDGFGHDGQGESAAVGAWTARVAVIAMLAIAAFVARRARSDFAAASAALAFLPVCLLASPVTWKAHHVLLLPLFLTLACAARRAARPWLAWSGLGLYYVACDLLSEGVVGRAGKVVLEKLSIVTWSDVGLFACAIVLAHRGSGNEGRPAEIVATAWDGSAA